MKVRWLFSSLLLLTTCRDLAQPLDAPDFPEPPQQQAGWSVSTNSTIAEVVSAAAALFLEGMADPRGCDYREIEIHIGEVWSGDGGTLRTHGWVLPVASTNQKRFAVCWNGLVYPVISVGEQIDLRADTESLLNFAKTNISRMRMALYGRAIPEKMSVATDTVLPIKTCLLLRLGEDRLAGAVWTACTASLESLRGQDPVKDPYLMLAGDWAWSLFDRTICAHMRGDVPLALVSARKLAEIQPEIEAEATKRGFPHPAYNDSQKHEKERPYIYFLDQLPQLLSDLGRRAREPEEKPVIENGLTNFPSQARRITALIDGLDEVSARQMGQPGRIMPEMDPIVAALIKEGEPAVDPLIDSMEHDTRLTRSVGFGRDFFRDRVIITVRRTAQAAIENILHTQFSGGVQEIRQFWSKYRGISQEDRWYQVLRDEKIAQGQPVRVTPAGGQERTETMIVLGRGQWMEAARMIVQPNNIVGIPNSGYYSSNTLPLGEDLKFRGEALRSKTNPTVTELLVKQASFVVEQANKLDQFQGVDAIRVGCELVQIINKWEKSAAVLPARSLMRRAIELSSDPNSFIMSSGHDLARYIPQLAEICIESGDTNVIPEYIAWIRMTDEEKVDEYPIEAFEPLWRNPNNPAVSSISEWLFNDPASPWSKLPWKRSHFHDPVDSNLTKLPSFRQLLVREMGDKSAAGSMQWQIGMGINIRYNVSGSSGGYHFDWPTVEAPTNNTKVEIRYCDWIAWKLSKSERISFFNPFATVEKRDKAIENAKAELLRSK